MKKLYNVPTMKAMTLTLNQQILAGSFSGGGLNMTISNEGASNAAESRSFNVWSDEE